MTLRRRLEERARGETSLPAGAERILSGAAALYGAGVRARGRFFDRGLLRVRRAARPVVSLGNLTAGGTGKTPLARLLARALLSRGFLPAILLRGYGVSPRSPRMAFPETWTAVGDEAALLAAWLPAVPVIACRDRGRAAREALAMVPPIDVFILDDGFQHRALERDLDVVLVDASDPWGGGRLLPAGRLREPRAALARADAVVLTRPSLASDLGLLRREIETLAPRASLAVADVRARSLVNREGLQRRPPEWLAGRRILAVAGIARPRAFVATLEALGAQVELAAFADHHAYRRRDIEALVARAAGRPIVTTEKDAIRWPGERPADLWVLETALVFLEGGEPLLERAAALAARATCR